MTARLRLLNGSDRNVRDYTYRQGLKLIGASLLALALAASAPAMAAETVKAKSRTSSDSAAQSDSKTEKKSEKKTGSKPELKSEAKTGTSAKKAPKPVETASADDGDSKPGKSSRTDKAKPDKDAAAAKAKATAGDTTKPSGKTSKLADANDTPEKTKADKPKPDAAKGDKAKAATSKTATKLADADDDAKAKSGPKSDKSSSDRSAKSSKTGAGKLARPVSKVELADAGDVKAPAGKSKAGKKGTASEDVDADDDTKVSKTSAAKSRKDKTELAEADDDVKAIKGAKARVIKAKDETLPAECKPAKVSKKSKKSKSSHRKPLPAICRMSKEDRELAAALTKASATLATAASHTRLLPQAQPTVSGVLASTTPVAAQGPAATPVMNAGPVPYASVRGQGTPSGILNATDTQLYQAAFSQIDQGDFDDAEASLAQVSDKSLVGYAEYHKLLGKTYSATYDELVAWLSQYGDQPNAMRVWDLAKRKKPAGMPDPAFPSLVGAQALAQSDNGAGVQLSATASLTPATPAATFNPGAPSVDNADSDLTPKSARSAYNNGQLEQAVTLARKIGDHWVAGLADWRLKRYDQALIEFKFVSTDPSRNAWSRSSGAYWAGRCALKLSDSDQADTYFKIAASYPFTFYGLLAETRLGVTPAVALSKKGLPPTFQGNEREALAASLDSDTSWTQDNVQAHRLSALVQLGRMSDAQSEVQSAIQTAGDGTQRDRWLALAATHHVRIGQLMTNDKLFDASLYPIPQYTLKAGDTGVDRALVFAFARKESKFNASAKSYAGAYGLMQLMPGTAALVENDPSFNSKPAKLLQPAVNMRVGQKYIQRLMASKAAGGDLLRTIAAYNAGPRPVQDAMDSLGTDADALLVMESIPVAQTRQYVEEVAANYWIYRQLMGKTSPSLIQAAGDARVIDATADAGVKPVAMLDEADD